MFLENLWSRSVVNHAVWVALFLLFLPQSARADEAKFHVIDVGTGMAVYMEFPAAKSGDRPIRVLYDTGLETNVAVDFLSSEEIGLRKASGDFQGDTIDYFFLSHPHEDHFNGAKNLFENFEVLNIIESKQTASSKYLSNFKIPALLEIETNKDNGRDANYYIVGLPYPNHFTFPKTVYGKAYNEYDLTEKYLPDFLKRRRGFKVDASDDSFPFYARDVGQTVSIPVELLVGFDSKKEYADEIEIIGETFPVTVLPIGTRFQFSEDSEITIYHGDSVAGLNIAITDDGPYKEAHPYFSEYDANDSSVAIRASFQNSSIFIPGDCEGHKKKPKEEISLEQLLGISDAPYSNSDLNSYIAKSGAERISLLRGFGRLKMGNRELLDLIRRSYVSFDEINPEDIDIKLPSGKFERSPKNHTKRSDFNSLPALAGYSKIRKDRATKSLLAYFELMQRDPNVLNAARGIFKSWNRGKDKRLLCAKTCELNTSEEVWNLMGLMQIATRLYLVDPELANVFAGIILSSEIYLEYVAPNDPKKRSLRAERHMLDVARIISKETGIANPLKSDILVFGHHGSFTSSSIDFVRTVEPNVGIISADDKVYGSGGGSLPDFLHLFWNINTYHEKPKKALHSIFLHADMIRIQRGLADPEVLEARRSDTANTIFERRGRNPIPIWRTDWNDDLTNSNTLTDNIAIRADGTPIWAWSRGVSSDLMRKIFDGENEDQYRYFEVMLFDTADFDTRIQPLDPRVEDPDIYAYPSTVQ